MLWLTASEIEDDPHDWLADTLVHAAEKLSMGTKLYASFYLLAHGCVKIFLVYSLWRERIWAFPVALSLIGALVCYSIYRFTHTHALALAVLRCHRLDHHVVHLARIPGTAAAASPVTSAV